MSDDNSSMDTGSNNPAGGVVAEHPPFTAHPVLVGPTTSDRRNTIRAAIIPIACWRLDDIRFEFSSSLIKPDIARELTLFAKLVKDHPGAPASIFGHADPIGNEEFNKKLSGRRAAVIYGMLTRNMDIWEDIYSQTGKFTAALQDDAWGLKAVKTILEALGYSPGPLDDQMRSQTREAVRNFQTDQGFQGRDVDGDPGPQTRAKLFLAFMDKICRDENDQPFKMMPADFLAQGIDREGKGDYQGCSEFNPVLRFSQEESDRFAQARYHTERNAANAPNRRVLALLFRPGSKVNMDRWPCPRAKEGVDACRKRFWSDSTRRLSLQAERRTFDQSHDTFACRFYQRISCDSPCEHLVQFKTLMIRLLDPYAKPIPKARYRLTIGQQQPWEGIADEDGWLVIREVEIPPTCHVQWSRPTADEQIATGETQATAIDYEYELEVYVELEESNEEEAMKRRLHNLGYSSEADLAGNIKAFQHDYGRPETGEIQDIRDVLIDWHDRADPRPRIQNVQR